MQRCERTVSAGVAAQVEQMLDGSRLALSRILTRVENGGPVAAAVLKQVAPRTGHALRIGFTGPPGAGKSSLVTAYVRYLRKLDGKVAVLAVDPTSPFSGGALLGDRIRMAAIGTDPGVYVRSMATRGDLGGLCQAAGDMADVLDACKYDHVLFETVGVGQSELEIVQYADTTVVVLVPESGDSIQGMKAGLMEIADVFVINKSDREGADRFASDLRSAMHLKEWSGWSPPIVMTVATKEQGIAEFHEKIGEHIQYLHDSGVFEQRRHDRLRRRAVRMIDEQLVRGYWSDARRTELETAIRNRKSPHEIAAEMLAASS
jgi:LAO/AO transport system kinase